MHVESEEPVGYPQWKGLEFRAAIRAQIMVKTIYVDETTQVEQ